MPVVAGRIDGLPWATGPAAKRARTTVSVKVTVEFRAMHADREPACSLIAAALAEGKSTYGEPERGEMPPATAVEMAPPEGAFLVAHERGLPVACGGLKRLDEGTAEIKRMYVIPAARGRGLGRSLLSALEEEARRLGYRSVRLDTGPRQAHARALYESAGYAAIPAYNRNAFADYWGEERL